MINQQQTLLLTFTGNGTRELTRSVEKQLRTEGHFCDKALHLADIPAPQSITELSSLVCIQGNSTGPRARAKFKDQALSNVQQWLAFGGRALVINIPTSDPHVSLTDVATEADRLTVLSLQDPAEVAQAISSWLESDPEPITTSPSSSTIILKPAAAEQHFIPTTIETLAEVEEPYRAIEEATSEPPLEASEQEIGRTVPTAEVAVPAPPSSPPRSHPPARDQGSKGKRRRSHSSSHSYGSDAAALDSFNRVAYGQGRTFPLGCFFAALTLLICTGLVILAIINF